MEKLYKTSEIKEILKVSMNTIYNYIRGEQLKAVKIGDKYRVTESELERFLKEGTEKRYTEKVFSKYKNYNKKIAEGKDTN